MYTLGIESTCDETGIAIVKDKNNILSNQIASQIEDHKIYGGVLPELASRGHFDQLLPLVDLSLQEAGITLQQLDLISVANGPGLMGSLIVGVNAAKAMALALKKPLIFVNHIEAHLYAATLGHNITFPALGVVLSGGHTALVKIFDYDSYELIGQTLDDAIGEAFDKVAKMLHLPYPGGPVIERLAKEGNPDKYPFKGGVVKKRPFDFSFSGIKTKVLYTLYGQNGKIDRQTSIPQQKVCDICASFQKAVFDDVVTKTLKAAAAHQCRAILFGGGVTNSQTLRKKIQQEGCGIQTFFPSYDLTLDNGAMIAALGVWKFLKEKPTSLLTDSPRTRIPFGMKRPPQLPKVFSRDRGA